MLSRRVSDVYLFPLIERLPLIAGTYLPAGSDGRQLPLARSGLVAGHAAGKAVEGSPCVARVGQTAAVRRCRWA